MASEPKASLITIPPECRARIYLPLSMRDGPIMISPLRQRPRARKGLKGYWQRTKDTLANTRPEIEEKNRNFGSLLRVNKLLNHEATPLFWCNNTFIVGTGGHGFGTTWQPTIHALETFMKRVPKEYIGYIRHVEIDIYMKVFERIPPPNAGPARRLPRFFYIGFEICYRNWVLKRTQTICDMVAQNFQRLEMVDIVMYPALWAHSPRNRDEYDCEDIEGDLDKQAAPFKQLLELPRLRFLNFNADTADNMRTFATAVLEGKGPEIRSLVNLTWMDGDQRMKNAIPL